MADLTTPDDTVMAAGQSFNKSWRIENSGDCMWTTSYEFIFIGGEQMGAVHTAQVHQDVPSGGVIDLSVNFTAPTEPGTYRSSWQLRTADGTPFGDTYYVQIVVADPTATDESANETPTEEPAPSETATEEPAASECSHEAEFMADVTIPDDTAIDPGESFTKTWLLQNSGTCTWTTSYELGFITGEQMAAPQSVNLNESVSKEAGIEISVDFRAPTEPGTYASVWQLRTPAGTLFGTKYYVQIVVADSNDVPTATEEPASETPTPEPPASETATEEPAPSECSHEAEFVADVTIPDDTVIDPGQSFTKTWRLQNSGTCTWTTSYELAFVTGEQMAAPQSVNLNESVSKEVGIEISVDFTAPTEPGTYASVWQLRTPDGTLFGSKYYVQIVVADPNDTPPTETPESIATLKKELFFLGQGGGGGGCYTSPKTTNIKIEIELYFNGNDICILNFKLDEIITVELSAPNGHLYSALYQIERDGEDLILLRTSPPMVGDNRQVSSINIYDDGTSNIPIPLWFPIGLPTGEWKVVASSATAYAEGSFTLESSGQGIKMKPNFEVNPFVAEHGDGCLVYSAGEQVEIVATGYPPNQELPFGIYKVIEDRLLLVSDANATVTTDNQGNFQTSVPVDSSYSAGNYYPFAVTDSDHQGIPSQAHCFAVP